MTRLFKRGARAVAAAALLGTAAVVPAQATDWNKLENSAWNGEAKADVQANAGAAADINAGGANAKASAGANASAGAEIAMAFQNLGMKPARAECYGKVLSEKLSPDDQQDAAKLVSSASNGDEVRSAVLNQGPEIVGGFSAANASCPKG